MSLDLNELAKIRGSNEWPLIKRYLLGEIEKGIGQLEDFLSIDETNLERGKVRAYRTMLRDIEQDLIDHPAQPVEYG